MVGERLLRDVQMNCRIGKLKAADFKATFQELTTTAPDYFEVWEEGRSSGLVIKRHWYNE